MASSMDDESSSLDTKHHILDLPSTALETILQQFSPDELATLCLVSRTFRDLAAAQLYRTFTHIFNDDDFRGGVVPVDLLAGTLETLATSDYNYAEYIKKIEMDTAYAADAGERACREFSYEYSCGKFLNTLLFATLKRIRALDTFIWNIRVELSTSVYKALHQMTSLQHVHIRLQAGPSLHSDSTATVSIANPINLPPPPGQVTLPPPPHPGPPPPHTHSHAPGGFATYPQNTQTRLSRRIPLLTPSSQPLSFSGFRGLKSLSVLDMDTLECIPELAACIRASSMSLKRLKLSFSDNLALKARKKISQDSDTDETAPEEDEFEDETLPPPPPPGMPPNDIAFGPASGNADGDVRSERLAQEMALARIFGLETETPEGKEAERAATQAIAKAHMETRMELDSSRKDLDDKSFVELMKFLLQDARKARDKAGTEATLKASSNAYQAVVALHKTASKFLQKADRNSKGGKAKALPSATSKSHGKNKKGKKQEPQYYIDGPISEEDEDDEEVPSPGMDTLNSAFTAPDQGDFLENFDFDSFLNTDPATNGTSAVPGELTNHVTNFVVQKSKQKKKGSNADWPSVSAKPGKKPISFGSFAPKSKGKENLKLVSPPSSSSVSAGEEEQGEQDVNGPHDADDESHASADAAIDIAKPEENKAEEVFTDDIDMEHPDDDGEEGDDQTFIDTPKTAADQESDSNADEIAEKPQVNGVTKHGEEAKSSSATRKGKEVVRDAPTPVKRRRRVTTEEAIQEYVRLNHGIPVEELSIYLIPVKPSVLCRAIDVCALKQITLLNVGPQRAFWAMLSKLHKTNPLQLQSVYTDNVTPSFLLFVNQLDYLEDLFLLERNSRTKVEPFAPKTTVMIEDIRQKVLKKHMKSLKTLMIRNDEDNNWNLNRESVKLISKEGRNLREIAVAMSAVHFHMLMQSISGLHSLHALQIIYSSSSDSCHSVLRELRSCIVDNLSHCPQVPVQYVALSHTINGSLSTFLMRLARNQTTPGDEDSDGETWAPDKIRVFEGLKLREARTVKIWDKEGWATRL